MDNNVKFWDLCNIERSLGDNLNESINNIMAVLQVKKYLNGKTFYNDIDLINILNECSSITFRGDARMFYALYERISELTNRELLEYVRTLIEQSRYTMGAVSPEALSYQMFSNVKSDDNDILICEADKYGPELYDLVKSSKSNYYFTIINKQFIDLYKYIYEEFNVTFIQSDIYQYEFTNKKFDLILCFPIMGGRDLANKEKSDFISRDLSFIATENLLYHLTPSGKLIIVLPAKIGFGGGDAETLRNYIQHTYKINEIASLPTKLFYPYMAINTYILSFSNGFTEDVCVKKYELENKRLHESDNRLVFSDELESMNVWNVDMVFSFTDESIIEYKSSSVKKAKLIEVSDVFRGKAITEKVDDGNVSVINISNISDTGIDYENLDTINEEERKISRYLLEDGDVLIATKGFAVKVGVFEKQDKMCIASSNLCVIRPNSRILNGTYLKLFLESETGMKLIKSLQRGTSIVNINYQDICELEVPTPPLDDQLDIANEYNAGLKLYKETISAANDAWSKIKNSVKMKLY